MASKWCARACLHLVLLFIHISKSDGDLRWVKHTGDARNLPVDAIVGGFEHEPIYIARAEHKGSLTPGKYFRSSNKAVISWGSRAHNKNEFEILCGTNYKWTFATTDNIPAGSLVGGRTEIVSDPLYIGRTNYSGHLILGKVQQALGACLIAYTGQELRTRLFEILVATEKTSSSVDVNPHWVKYEGSLPADAIVGGFENEVLYVGRAEHRGSVTPGKFIPSIGKLVISWGFKTHEKDNFEILCGTNYKWTALRTYDIPDEAVDAGIINHPVFVGRANYSNHVIPGKINIEHPYVKVPYGEKAFRILDVEVLVATGANGKDDPYWVKYDRNTHAIPPDAIVAGFENEDLYVARTNEDGINVGKFVPSLQKAFIPLQKSVPKEDFEILCGKNYKWVKPIKDRMPDRTIVAGRDENTQPLYVGRGKKDGHLIPGKAVKDRSWCLIPFNGNEIFLKEEYYEILLVPAKSNFLEQFNPKPIKGTAPAECKPTLTKVHNGVACAGQILFEDTFDSFRDDLWQIEQYIPVHSTEFPFVSYQRLPENPTVSVDGGNLHITPKLQQQIPGFSDASIFTGNLNLITGCTASPDACSKQAWGASILPPIVSGRITSKGFAFTYGTVHIRAKLPQGDWLYPEILLQPLLMKYGSTHHSSGVINIASARGNKELSNGYADYSNKILYGGAIMDVQCRDLLLTDRLSNNGAPWGDDFHEYSMKWTPDNIILSVDGVEWARVESGSSGLVGRFPRVCGELPRQALRAGAKMAPFDDFFYLTLGVAAGSIMEFPDNIQTSGGHEKPWSNPSSKAMLHFWQDLDAWFATWNKPQLIVDYIKVVAL